MLQATLPESSLIPIYAAALVSVIGAVAAAVVSIRTKRDVAAVSVKADKINDNQLILDKGQQAIHVLVNSRLSEALDKIAHLEDRIATFTGLQTDIREADKSATAAKNQAKGPTVSTPFPSIVPDSTLEAQPAATPRPMPAATRDPGPRGSTAS